MAIPTVHLRQRYVYALLREDMVTPFYIGIGKGDRWLHHEKNAWRSKTHKDRIILKMQKSGTTSIPKIKLFIALTDSEAQAIERCLIFSFGRYPTGPLVNMTDGGEGLLNPSKEVREKMRESGKRRVRSATEIELFMSNAKRRTSWAPSVETRAKISKSLSGRKLDESRRLGIAMRMKESWKNPVLREKFMTTSGNFGNPMKPHVKAALRKANLGRPKTPQECAKIAEAIRGIKRSQESIEKMRKVQQNRSPDTREKLAKSQKSFWESMTPEQRTERAEKIRQGMLRHRATST